MNNKITLLFLMMRHYFINNVASFTFLIVLLMSYFIYFIYFLLMPIYQSTYINDDIFIVDRYSSLDYLLNYNKELSNYLNTFEIILPFYSTEFYYIKISILISILILVPLLIYIALKETVFIYNYEKNKHYRTIMNIFIMYGLVNYFVYYKILPFIIKWVIQHYNNLLIFEFNMQFDIINYISLIFKLFIVNLIIIIILYVKQLYLNINYVIFYLLVLAILNINDLLIIGITFILYYVVIKLIIYINVLYLNNLLINFNNTIIQRKSNI
jgi:hypothetical protein